MAVGQGFEPWELLHSTVFKTAAFDHSATPPELRGRLYRGFFLGQAGKLLFLIEKSFFPQTARKSSRYRPEFPSGLSGFMYDGSYTPSA